MRATFAILQHEQAIVQDVGLTTKFLSLLHHLSRSTEFLWIFNAELLKKSSMPVFSSQEIFYWVICARRTYCLCCLSDKVSMSIYYDARLWTNWVIWEKFRLIIVMWCSKPVLAPSFKASHSLRDSVLKRTHLSWGFQPTWAHNYYPPTPFCWVGNSSHEYASPSVKPRASVVTLKLVRPVELM